MDIVIKSQKIKLLDSPELLTDAIKWLEDKSVIAVDTESDSLFVYYEKVCLLQLTDGSRNFIADPLVLGNLDHLNPLFESKSILKIFHAAEYDIMCLKRDYGFTFNNVFDTMIAARILGRKEIGLGSLIEQEFGIHLEKKFQKSNWGLRPLPEDMLLYATLDTSFLIDLRDHLEKELIDRDLMALAQEDFNRVCKSPPAAAEPVSIQWWRIAGNNRDLTFQQAAALQNLCVLREQIAKKMDLPLFKVIQNDVLVELALQKPATETDLSEIKGLTKFIIKKYGKSILTAIESSKNARSLPRPANIPKPSMDVLNRKDLLKNWRKEMGLKYDVPSDVILPKDILEKIASENPKGKEDLKLIMNDIPWRYQHFSEQILSVIR
jgi:ribonuclease D